MLRRNLLGLSLLASVLLVTPLAKAEPSVALDAGTPAELPADAPERAEGSRLRGTMPSPMPTISVSFDDEDLNDALQEVARQAGWGLFIEDGQRLHGRHVTFKAQGLAASQALESLLEAGDLSARFDGGLLKVTPAGRHHRRQRPGGHDNSRVSFGNDATVGANETVDDAVVIGGSLTVDGHVRGDAVAVGGPLKLGPAAVVEGDAVAVGGAIDADPSAVIQGDRTAVGGSLGGLAHHMPGLLGLGAGTMLVFGFLGWLLKGVVWLLTGVVLLSLMPARIERVRDFLAARPGASAGAGAGLLVGFVPACVLLVVTCVGIALVPVAIFGLVALMAVGLTSLALLIGERIPLWQGRKSSMGSFLMGMALLWAVGLVPFVGPVAVLLAAFHGAGAALLSRFGRPSDALAAGSPAPPEAPPTP